MKLFKTSVIAMALSVVCSAQAEKLAIINATVHTATEQGVLTNAAVIVENGKIVSINPEHIDAEQQFDAKGKILTPGFIAPMSQLGLVEVGAVAGSRDASDKKADVTFDPSTAFNSLSSAIAYHRKGGITRSVVAPTKGESLFNGQAFAVTLSNDIDSVTHSKIGVVVSLGAESKGSRAMNIQTLRNELTEAQQAITKAEAKNKDKKAKSDDQVELKPAQQVFKSLLAGEIPLIVQADRLSDLTALLKIKQEFSLDLVILGAADAELIADQLAAENIPVVIDAMRNLPGSFDSMHVSLTSAANLVAKGVKVAFYVGGAHNLYQLRFDAGNAIANGLSKADALAAISANVADIFKLDSGRIAVGKSADLVLWNTDPFELDSKVEQLWIAGEAFSTQSRHDKLRVRYTTPSPMPRAYTK